jgi:natural resistance-associated macrophage protein
MLLDFFSSVAKGLLSSSALCVAVVAYAMFILYLIFRGTEFSNYFLSRVHKNTLA